MAVVVFTLMSQFHRGAMNDRNIARYGERADYHKDLGGAFVGSLLVGVLYAAIATAVAGFIF
ncbi:hypothetical protein [Mesorhizobium caraganae]|uniref:hypothetical protein n=1 Tax=Mesorhizobium caraganae TaxID=483206 RepID=UPI003338DCE6